MRRRLAPLQQQVAALEQAVGELRNQPRSRKPLRSPAAARGAAGGAGKARTRRGCRRRDCGARSAAGGSLRPGRGAEEHPATAPVSPETRLRSMRSPSACRARDPTARSALRPRRIDCGAAERFAQLSARLDGLPTEERVAALETGLKTTSEQVAKVDALGPAVAANALADALQSGAPYRRRARGAARPRPRRGDAVGARAASRERPADARRPALRLRGGGSRDRPRAQPSRRRPARSTACSAARAASSRCGRRDPTEGTDPAAILSRIRGALAAGDLKTALAEWKRCRKPRSRR